MIHDGPDAAHAFHCVAGAGVVARVAFRCAQSRVSRARPRALHPARAPTHAIAARPAPSPAGAARAKQEARPPAQQSISAHGAESRPYARDDTGADAIAAALSDFGLLGGGGFEDDEQDITVVDNREPRMEEVVRCVRTVLGGEGWRAGQLGQGVGGEGATGADRRWGPPGAAHGGSGG